MAKNDNTGLLIIGGILLLFVILSQFPLPDFPFAVVTKTTCIDNTVSEWEFDGNTLDTRGVNNAQGNNISFISGKFGQAIEFKGGNSSFVSFPVSEYKGIVMWIKNYSKGDSDYVFVARDSNGTDYVNAVQGSSRQVIPLGSDFGKNFNGSIDRAALINNLDSEMISQIYANGSGADVCFQTEENVTLTCEEYAEQELLDETGCIEVSGDNYPNCTFNQNSAGNYFVENGECNEYFLCQDSCTEENNCYTSLSSCEDSLTQESSSDSSTTTTSESDERKSLQEIADSCLIDIGDYCIKLIHLVLIFIIAVLVLYAAGVFEK